MEAIKKNQAERKNSFWTDDLSPYHSYFKFSFVRNPWDRLVSLYFNLIGNLNRRGGLKRRFNKQFPKGIKISFKQTVQEIAAIPDKQSDVHWTSQYVNFVDAKGSLILDFMGRLESIDDVEVVKQKTSLKFELGCYRKTLHEPYWAYYDDETIDLVAQRYKKDIEMFGYSFKQ